MTFWFTEELCHIELCPCEWRFRVHGMFRIIIIIYVLLLMGLLCLICFLLMFFFFYMLFLLGGLFKRTFHVEKNAERDKLAVTMGKKTGGRFKDDWDWLKMKGGNEQKRPTWIISVDVSMAVSWLVNCGYYNYLLIGMIFQVPRKGERHVSRYSLYDVRNISQFWRKNVNR